MSSQQFYGRTSGVAEVGFFIRMNESTLTPEFSPPRGSVELTALINAYIPGPATLNDKISQIMMEFFKHRMESDASQKFFKVPAMLSPLSDACSSTGSPATSSATWSFDALSQPPAFQAPSLTSTYAPLTATQIACASQIMSAPKMSTMSRKLSVSSRTSTSPSIPSPSRSTASSQRIPGMTILSRDGQDITDVASRGSKTREQREHAHMMRKLGACTSCKRKKIKCDPSHVSAIAGSPAIGPISTSAPSRSRVKAAVRKVNARAGASAGTSLTPAPTPAFISFSSSPATTAPATLAVAHSTSMAPMTKTQPTMSSPPSQIGSDFNFDFDMLIDNNLFSDPMLSTEAFDQTSQVDWSMGLSSAEILALIQASPLQEVQQLQTQQQQSPSTALPFDIDLTRPDFNLEGYKYEDFTLYSGTSSPMSINDQILSVSSDIPSVNSEDVVEVVAKAHHHPHRDHGHGDVQSHSPVTATDISPQNLSSASNFAAADITADLDLSLGQSVLYSRDEFTRAELSQPMHLAADTFSSHTTASGNDGFVTFALPDCNDDFAVAGYLEVNSVAAHIGGSQSSPGALLATQPLLDGPALQAQLSQRLPPPLSLGESDFASQSGSVVTDQNTVPNVEVGVGFGAGIGVDFNPGINAVADNAAVNARHVAPQHHLGQPKLSELISEHLPGTSTSQAVLRGVACNAPSASPEVFTLDTNTLDVSIPDAVQQQISDAIHSRISGATHRRSAIGHSFMPQKYVSTHDLALTALESTNAPHYQVTTNDFFNDNGASLWSPVQAVASTTTQTLNSAICSTPRVCSASEARTHLWEAQDTVVSHALQNTAGALSSTDQALGVVPEWTSIIATRPQGWSRRGLSALLLSPAVDSRTGHVQDIDNNRKQQMPATSILKAVLAESAKPAKETLSVVSSRGYSAGHALLSAMVTFSKSSFTFAACLAHVFSSPAFTLGWFAIAVLLLNSRIELLIILGQICAIIALSGAQFFRNCRADTKSTLLRTSKFNTHKVQMPLV